MKNTKLKNSYNVIKSIQKPANINKKQTWSNNSSVHVKFFDQLSPSEVYNILKIRQDVFIVEMRIVYEDIDGKDAQCFHLWCQDDLSHDFLSYLRIVPLREKKQVSIGRVLTVPDARGQGLCNKMMKKAISFIQSSFPGHLITLTAKEDLYQFYKVLGFKKEGEPFFYPENDPTPIFPMIYSPNHKNILPRFYKAGKKKWA